MAEVDESTGIRHVMVMPFCNCMYDRQSSIGSPLRWRDDEYGFVRVAVEYLKARHVCRARA